MIRAIAFDLWGVIAHKRPRVFDLVAAEMGLGPDAHPYFVKLLEQMELGIMSESDFWAQFLRQHRAPVDRQMTPWVEHYRYLTQLNHELLALIADLRGSHKIALISNTDPAAAAFMRHSGILDDFDAVIFSCEARAVKPDEAIYRLALQQLGVRPSEMVFVDDRQSNIDAANNMGIMGLKYGSVPELTTALAEHLVA